MNDTNIFQGENLKPVLILLTLCSFYMVFMLSTSILAYVPTNIFFLIEPGGIYGFSLTFIIAAIICETYGYQVSRAIVILGIACNAVFAILLNSVLHLFPHPEFWGNYEHYTIVLNPTVRFVIASFCGMIVGELINIYGLWRWKIKWRGKYYALRSTAWIAIGQFAVSFINDMFLYFSIYPFGKIMNMVFSGFFFKMLVSFILIVPSVAAVNYLKSIGIDAAEDTKNKLFFKFNIRPSILSGKHS